MDLLQETETWTRGREYAVVSHHVLDLAARSGCSAYDCEFVALAEDLNVKLVTNDRQLLKAFPRIAIAPKDFAG
jgi:predicted nucleic acid-binding protein